MVSWNNFVECCFFQKVTRLLSRHVLRVYQGPLATSKEITAKNVTFKKSSRFSNFFYRDYFNSLKTSNICKFSGIEFLGPNPSWEGERKICHGVVKASIKLPVREFHVTKCATSRAVFFFANLSLPSPSSLKKLPNLFNRDFPLWSCKKTFSFGHIISPLLAKPVQSR